MQHSLLQCTPGVPHKRTVVLCAVGQEEEIRPAHVVHLNDFITIFVDLARAQVATCALAGHAAGRIKGGASRHRRQRIIAFVIVRPRNTLGTALGAFIIGMQWSSGERGRAKKAAAEGRLLEALSTGRAVVLRARMPFEQHFFGSCSL